MGFAWGSLLSSRCDPALGRMFGKGNEVAYG